MEDGRKIYTVSELNNEIKVILEDSYPDIWVEGEISNFKSFASGHMYFSLKDEESQVSAVIWNGINRFLKFKPEDGLKVIIRGKISSYPKRGDYQLIVNYIEPAGKGALQLAFEQLKKKLEKEGLFDPVKKKPIPILPQKIGIVTSPDGAAVRDILSVIERRFANVEVLIYPAKVQGEEAKFEIAEGIAHLNLEHSDIDVLLVGRGGGSMEDLWAFNEEIVARAIAGSSIPIISCVGHETDFTIADFVADLRAPTPSAAAELVVRNKQELEEKFSNIRRNLVSIMKGKISVYEERIEKLSSARSLTSPFGVFEERDQLIDEQYEKLCSFAQNLLTAKISCFELLKQKLGLLSPLNVLDRGYSICFKGDDKIPLKDAASLKERDLVRILLSNGEIKALVDNIILNGGTNEKSN